MTPEMEALKVVAKAARRYFVGYVQDEAEDPECCISDEQHEDAKALESALAALEEIPPSPDLKASQRPTVSSETTSPPTQSHLAGKGEL